MLKGWWSTTSTFRGLPELNIILFDAAELDTIQCLRLRDARADHIRTVLKAVPGQGLRIGLINGPRGTGVVESVADNEVVLSCGLESEIPSRPRVDILLALPRPKVMKRLWSRLAVMGVGRILLTNAEKVERMYFDSHVLDPACIRRGLLNGLQQAGDTLLPAVSVHRRFKVLLEDELDALAPDATRLVADPAARMTLIQRMDACPNAAGRLLISIGPEGGWTRYALGQLASHGFRAFYLSHRILTTELACISALALAAGASCPELF